MPWTLQDSLWLMLLNKAAHLSTHFLSYSVVDLESFPKVSFVSNLGISPSPKIVGKLYTLPTCFSFPGN